MPPQPTDLEDTTFQKWQDIAGGITAGFLKSCTKYLPHAIAVVAASLAVANHFKESEDHAKEKASTQTIWQHSGQWESNRLAIVDMVITSSNTLQEEIEQLQTERKQ